MEEEELFTTAINIYSFSETLGMVFNQGDNLKNLELDSFTHKEAKSENYIKLILKYLRLYQPTEYLESFHRVLITQFKSFWLDLELHEWIEDEILLPRLKEY